MIFKKIILSFFYFFIAYFFSLILKKILKTAIFGVEKTKNEKLVKKSQTLKSFIDSIIYVFVYFGAIYYILSLWEINITPFLTSAGIIGLAFSFGAQSLAKDIISGFFIIFDNQFEVGDYVKIGSLKGKVKKITLRQTILKDEEGNIIIIPNSQINSVVKIKKTTNT
ncbi:MAG: mechanosensitive ion channel family protein [Patescibacteria group bacterium]|nr:mechanosensitive ion channel family protein [Patescibacteria group bacterium]